MNAARQLTGASERAALSFLSQSPYENVFLWWMIESDRSASARASLYTYCEEDGAGVHGVAFFGRQVVLAADTEAAIAAFARVAREHGRERMIVGERGVIETFWSEVRSWHRPARVTRERQPVFALERSRLRVPDSKVTARRARPSEWQEVAANSAQMIRHELEYDPRSANPDYDAGVRAMIDRGLWWVGESEGRLCFFCNAGPRSPQTLQLQGIWTPPGLRGKGLATAALAAVCAQLLDEVPTLSLYVNSFNRPAINLYERTGFERAGEFKTLLF